MALHEALVRTSFPARNLRSGKSFALIVLPRSARSKDCPSRCLPKPANPATQSKASCRSAAAAAAPGAVRGASPTANALAPPIRRVRRSGKHFRLTHFAILNDHLHLLAEAEDQIALKGAMQGLLIRVAVGLNKLWQRCGALFADRYHSRALTTPRAVRNALCCVLANGKKHAAEGRAVAVPQAIDLFSSAPWFDGFRESVTVHNRPAEPPRTWLLSIGWRHRGLLSVHDLQACG